MAESAVEQSTNYRLPTSTTLQHCAKLGIVEDKPIMTLYDKYINKATLVA